MSNRNFQDPRYVKWRNRCFKRDKYCCQYPSCPNNGGKLNVHHIKRYANFPALRFDPNNGITLCERHHTMTFGKEEEFEALFTKIVQDKRVEKDIEILRIKYGK